MIIMASEGYLQYEKRGGNGRPGQSHGNKVLVIRSASVHRAVNYN